MSQTTGNSYKQRPMMRALETNVTNTAFALGEIPFASTGINAFPQSVDAGAASYAFLKAVGLEIVILPFATDANNEQFAMRVILWKLAPGGSIKGTFTLDLWTVLRKGMLFDCTVSGTANGVANTQASELEFFADTITETASPSNTWDDNLVTVDSHAGDTPEIVRVGLIGADAVSLDFDIDPLSTDASTANALYYFV